MERDNKVGTFANTDCVLNEATRSGDLEPLQPQQSWESPRSLGSVENRAYSNEGDSESPRQHFAACRKSVDFLMDQYLQYIDSARKSGIEPKDLLSGLEITESGPNAAPLDFWSLINVRDRLIVELNNLLEPVRLKHREALRSLRTSGPFVFVMATVLQFFPMRWIRLLSIPVLSYSLFKGFKVAMAWRDGIRLQAIIERATNWELEEKDKKDVRSLCYYMYE
ncbi:hypothetical protein PT974_12464 [Cladobotryum mycophilum]|uniref:Uncharacterized protein n=1 Tax=Cladobotryum mycophilum TaxID=491253 RepID=A0ABR0S826_9HYPO